MLKSHLLVLFSISIFAGCSHKTAESPFPTRTTASLGEGLSEKTFQISREEWIKNLEGKVSLAQNSSRCTEEMSALGEAIYSFDLKQLEKNWINAHGAEAISDLGAFRFALNGRIKEVPVDCRVYVGEIFARIRDIEDYIGESYYKVEKLYGEKVDYKKQPVPLKEASRYNPYLLNPRFKSFKFEPGDIMITRGISFMSASIAQSTSLPSKFSHGVFVYVNEKGVEQTIESYIPTGVEFFSMKDALQNENARIMVFRSKDRALAQAANDIMSKEIKERGEKGTGSLTYDYDANMEDHSRLTCIEIPYAAYEWASQGQVKIPQSKSHMMLTKKDLIQGLKAKTGPVFSPFNVETDDRFELVLDWTDYRLSQDQRNKDIVVRKMFDLIENHNYEIQENISSIAARVIWNSRGIKPLWSVWGGVGGLNKLPKEMPLDQITITAKLYKSAGIFLQAVRDWQAREPNRIFTNQEIKSWVDAFVEKDRENYIQRKRADLHIYFRPYELKQTPTGDL